MIRSILVAALLGAAFVAGLTLLTACNEGGKKSTPELSSNDNSFARVGEVHGGPGMKGASYVTCVSPSGEFNVYVPPEKNHTFAAGQVCPDGGRW